MQIAILCFGDAKFLQIQAGRSLDYIPLRIVTRTVTWAFKSEIALLNGTSQMAADKAECAHTLFIVNNDCGNMGDDGAAMDRIVDRRSDIKLALRCGIKLITQIADQPAESENTRQGKERIRGKL